MNSTERRQAEQSTMNQNLIRELAESQKRIREIQHRMKIESAKLKGELDLLCQLYQLTPLDIPSANAYLSIASGNHPKRPNGG